MQPLEVISVNIWHILISLLNLVIVFFIVKRFLYQPVKNLLASRKADIDHQYAAAAAAEEQANANKAAWEKKLRGVKAKADAIIDDATVIAKRRAEKIVLDATEKADGIVKRAEEEAILESRRAAEGIKHDIVEVSTALAEKMLEREVKPEDHRALIDSFIDAIGDENA